MGLGVESRVQWDDQLYQPMAGRWTLVFSDLASHNPSNASWLDALVMAIPDGHLPTRQQCWCLPYMNELIISSFALHFLAWTSAECCEV